MGEPASPSRTADRAAGLVRRARRRAFSNAASRAVLAGAAVGALSAAAIVLTLRLAGLAPSWWPALGVLPGALAAALRLRRARPSLTAAALLLDRAADTGERLLAAVTATDPEVGDYVARQALDRPGLKDGGFPLRFPPSAEGLAAVLSVALLAGSFLLGPDVSPDGGDGRETARVPGASEPATPGPGAERVEPPPDATATKRGAPVVTRIESGEDLSEGDWRELSAAGLTEDERESIRAALAAGDRGGAAEAARAALRRAAVKPMPPPTVEGGPWGAYGRALESPGWSPAFDGVVSEYFRASGQRGLR